MTTLSNEQERGTQSRNRRIRSSKNPMVPRTAHEDWPVTDDAAAHVFASQQTVVNILNGEDTRMLIVCGPCSIHSREQAVACGHWIRAMQERFGDQAFFVMRYCVEKPRSTTGWEGLFFDPFYDDSMKEDEGIRLSREIGIELAQMGVPLAMEFLHTDTAQMLDDLVTLAWIGARTVSNPNMRRFAGGVSMPVGFKNDEGGRIKPAIQAMQTAATPGLQFRSIDDDGLRAFFEVEGNADTFIILRGSESGSNAESGHIKQAGDMMTKADVPLRLVVDCNHKNCSGGPENQIKPLQSAMRERRAGAPVLGAMLEVSPEEYGSRTDPCATLEQCEHMFAHALV